MIGAKPPKAFPLDPVSFRRGRIRSQRERLDPSTVPKLTSRTRIPVFARVFNFSRGCVHPGDGAASHAFLPVDGLPLELQSDTIASVWEPLAINHSSESSQISNDSID